MTDRQWEDRVEKTFDDFCNVVAEAADRDAPPTDAERIAVEITREHRESAYLIYMTGWIAAMSYASEWLALAAGHDDEDDV